MMRKFVKTCAATAWLWTLPFFLTASTVVLAEEALPDFSVGDSDSSAVFPDTVQHALSTDLVRLPSDAPAPVASTPVAASSEANWVQPASYANDVSFGRAEPPVPALGIPTIEQIREEIKRKDAGTDDSSAYGRGMTLVLDSEGKKYIRFLSWLQAETAFTDNNPGTVDAYGNLNSSSLDIALRRARFLSYAQLTERYLILLHFGINNQTFTNGGGSGTGGIGGYGAGKKPQLFFHDVWNEYAVIPQSDCRDFSLSVGAGLHYWNGVSRKSNASTLKFMTLDAPVFNWPNIELTDQFGRQLGWYAKGKFRRLDYRLAINHPFNADNRAALNDERAVNIATDNLAYAGYLEWQLWDQEA